MSESESPDAPGEKFEYKTSRAMQIWLAVVAVILVILFFQTQDKSQHGYNLLVNSGPADIGKDVFVDDKKAGSLADGEKHGLEGAVLWLKLPEGEHSVKLADSPVAKPIKVNGKHYLRFDSGNSEDTNTSSPLD